MKYEHMTPGIFLARPNRFIAHVEIDGQTEVVHVKNTGRCRELLVPGCTVYCQRSGNPSRKTKFDLIAVRKGDRLINMDSQAPNKAAGEWLAAGGLGEISQLRAEVKGCTLEEDGVCAFPDAPTERGAKHIRGLTELAKAGYGAFILFVIQMADVKYIRPHDETDPEFGRALREAAANGVRVLAMDCAVDVDSMELRLPVLVKL